MNYFLIKFKINLTYKRKYLRLIQVSISNKNSKNLKGGV